VVGSQDLTEQCSYNPLPAGTVSSNEGMRETLARLAYYVVALYSLLMTMWRLYTYTLLPSSLCPAIDVLVC
jgi:hypothetical protein